jgi:hypothetical protein
MSESRNCDAGWHDRCHGSAQEQRGMGQRWASVRRRSECECPHGPSEPGRPTQVVAATLADDMD